MFKTCCTLGVGKGTSARGVFSVVNLRVVIIFMAYCANVRNRLWFGAAAGAAEVGMTSARFLGDTRSVCVCLASS